MPGSLHKFTYYTGKGSSTVQEIYADIIVNITSHQLDHPFSYRATGELASRIEPGMVVEVPFGAGDRLIRGYVIRLLESSTLSPDKIKDVRSIVTDGLGQTDRLIQLAAWMRARYGCTMIAALKTVIPSNRKVRSREKTILTLALDREAAIEQLAVYEKKHQTARARLLSALLEEPSLPRELVADKLGITTPVINALEKQGVLTKRSEKVWRLPDTNAAEAETAKITLTLAQRKIVEEVAKDLDRGGARGTYLIHGVTGSGKTAVYMELIDEVIRRGEQAIVLIPEIALTWQTVLRFYRRFGGKVARIHSRLSQGEKQDAFEMARRGEVSVMIGPRSALFTPFPNLGMIVIDEEHEGAYRSEQTPRYDAVETALQRGILEGAAVVLGSATPSLDSFYKAERGDIRLFSLPERAAGAALPEVAVVDMRQELKNGNRSPISALLQDEIRHALDAGQQIMLFLNRRGIAGALSCRSCGHVIKCPHCDVSLSLHEGSRLICHYCGHEERSYHTCPSCGSPFIRPMKAGTQQMEQEIHRLFPDARLMRMDLDTTRQKDSYDQLLSSFRDHEADILIGTQMIVKGHDFPNVTVMGVLAADISLNASDYRSAERTFQLLTQAVGRAGRSGQSGKAVIQTYEPEHYAIKAAARQDYLSFYQSEIAVRKLGLYPPVGCLTAIHISGPEEDYVSMAAEYLGKYARHISMRSDAQVLGPADETVTRIADQYRKVLYLKANNAKEVQLLREKLDRYIEINEGFKHVLIQYDVE